MRAWPGTSSGSTLPRRRTGTPLSPSCSPHRATMQPAAPAAAAASCYQWQAAMSAAGEQALHPAAERNKAPILEVLQRLLPHQGGLPGNGAQLVLEVASGSGQHAAHFAAALPGLTWQPSDVSDALFPSIAAHCMDLPNVRPPLLLDASSSPDTWPLQQEPLAAVLASNLTHISPWAATQGLVAGAGRWLAPGGLLAIYGPFTLGGQFTSDSNLEFHRHLTATNPAWGYRDTADIQALAAAAGLTPLPDTPLPMPANNFMLLFTKAQQ